MRMSIYIHIHAHIYRVFLNCWNKPAASQILPLDFILFFVSDYCRKIVTIFIYLTKYSEIIPWMMEQIFCVRTNEDHWISFPTFFVWALLLIVHSWKPSPLPNNLLWLQCTCTIPTTSERPYGSRLVWACQWPSSQPLSSPQLSHNDSLWA